MAPNGPERAFTGGKKPIHPGFKLFIDDNPAVEIFHRRADFHRFIFFEHSSQIGQIQCFIFPVGNTRGSLRSIVSQGICPRPDIDPRHPEILFPPDFFTRGEGNKTLIPLHVRAAFDDKRIIFI